MPSCGRSGRRPVALELEVATLEGSLTTFQTVYLKRCGRLYAEIDEVDAEYAQLLVEPAPRRRGADPPGEGGHGEGGGVPDGRGGAREQARAAEVRAGRGLKSAFRRAARDMHPDHAPDEEQARIRHDWMVELNALYQHQDLDGIRALVADFKAHVVRTAVPGGAPLTAVIESLTRKVRTALTTIARLERRLERTPARRARTTCGPARRRRRRRARTSSARSRGSRHRLRQARTRLEALRRRRGSP